MRSYLTALHKLQLLRSSLCTRLIMHAGAQDGVVRLWGAPRGSLHLWQPSECWSADVPPVGVLLLAPPLLWSSSSSGQTLVLCLLCWPSTAWAVCASSLMPSSLLHCALEHSCQPLLSYHASLKEARAWGQIYAATQAHCGVGHSMLLPKRRHKLCASRVSCSMQELQHDWSFSWRKGLVLFLQQVSICMQLC